MKIFSRLVSLEALGWPRRIKRSHAICTLGPYLQPVQETNPVKGIKHPDVIRFLVRIVSALHWNRWASNFPAPPVVVTFRSIEVSIIQDTLALEYGEQPLAKYSVEWQPNDKSLRRVGNPRLYNHPYQSPQLELWSTSDIEWYVIIQAKSYGSRPLRKKNRLVFLQLPLPADGTQG